MRAALKLLIIFCLGACAVHADTVTYSDSTAMVSMQNATISLNQFDQSLGTLTSVYIEYTTLLYDIDYQFDNDIVGGFPKTVTINLSSYAGYFYTEARLTGTGINTDGSDLHINAFGSLTLQPDDGDTAGQFDVGGTDYGQWAPEDQSSTTGGYVESSVFSDYIGTGTFDSTVISEILAGVNSYTDIEEGSNELPSGLFSAKVIYGYVGAVPEPAAISLIGLGGLLTLTVKRLRRFSK